MAADQSARRSVAARSEGRRTSNTLVIPGHDVVIPVELDLDGDPFQDDEVRISAELGGYERVLRSSDPSVTRAPEAAWLLYRFERVPYGVYRVSVRVAGRWMLLHLGLVVRRRGVFMGDRELTTELPASPSRAAERGGPDEIVAGDEASDEPVPSTLDQAEIDGDW